MFHRSVEIALRLAGIGTCCYGICTSVQLARADLLFKEDTEKSVRAAAQLVPDSWQYDLRLAQFDREQARDLLADSLRLNRYNAQADIELALHYEADGDFSRAEQLLLEAFDIDHTYLPRWSLANYYLRRDNLPQFWAWARRAAEMPSEEVGSLFELCWRVTPDAAAIDRSIMNGNPELLRQYTEWLLSKEELTAAASIGSRLVNAGSPEVDRPLLFAVINRLVAAKDGQAGDRLWRSLVARQWAVADSPLPNNADFAREPLPVAFDWSLPEYSGLHSWTASPGLETEFAGNEPEECTVAEQFVYLAANTYRLSYSYRTKDIGPQTGIRWQVIDIETNNLLAESPNLSSDQERQPSFEFAVPASSSLVRIRLVYHRTVGTSRISGTLVIRSTQLTIQSAS